GVGGGVFIASVLVGWHLGLLVGVGITAILKGGAHLLFLTHPWKFWRIFWRPQTSWISRGIYFVSLFVIFGLAYYFMGGAILRAISVFFALCLVIYTGFVLLASRPISFWNNPLLPILFVSVSLASGISLTETIHIFSPQDMANPELLKIAGPWGVSITALLLLVYLAGNFYASITAKESLMYLLKGQLAPLFYSGVVVLGIILPLAIFISAYLSILPSSALAVAGICELVGAFILRYSILKAGISASVA
ncbi:MAG: NrfD/PsrC family molybdoenzyme membrane anchor subunit, partial [Deltaproteobacteria bacterium]|nr:NrfD/PsrC family molybdoenzyme membrane anchor subunit [Deltaproteobacteria bacterium]